MTDIEDLTELLVKFRDERDWEQFHDSKNLALALSIEAAELNELFLWMNIYLHWKKIRLIPCPIKN